MYETDATVNNRAWLIKANAHALTFYPAVDAFTVGNAWLTVTRSTVIPTEIAFGFSGAGTILTLNTVAIPTISSAHTLSSKSISLTTNTLTGTTAEFNTALSDGNFLTDASIGVTVQAYSANLDEYAAVNPTPAGLALLDDITLDGTIAGAPTLSGVWTWTSTGIVIAPTSGNAGMEFGGRGYSNTPFIDFHSGATDVDYDVRLIASGGTGVAGGGTLTFTGGTLALGSSTITGAATITSSWTWTTTAAGTSPVTIKSTEAGASSGPLFDLYRDSTSPAISDSLGAIRFRGEDDGGGDNAYTQIGASILDPAAGAEAGSMNLLTSVAGTLATRVTIRSGMFMTGATGGDQGAGTINATAVYDDGVILTDYVPDAYIDGDYSVTDYDSRIPPRRLEDGTIVPRQHGPARRFKTNFDELDPVLFSNKWKASRKLPAFNRGPERKSTGESIQALIETCEILAVHLDKHETRIQALE